MNEALSAVAVAIGSATLLVCGVVGQESISGVVTHFSGGPVADCQIRAYRRADGAYSDQVPVGRGKSDSKGHFVIESSEPNLSTVILEARLDGAAASTVECRWGEHQVIELLDAGGDITVAVKGAKGRPWQAWLMRQGWRSVAKKPGDLFWRRFEPGLGIGLPMTSEQGELRLGIPASAETLFVVVRVSDDLAGFGFTNRQSGVMDVTVEVQEIAKSRVLLDGCTADSVQIARAGALPLPAVVTRENGKDYVDVTGLPGSYHVLSRSGKRIMMELGDGGEYVKLDCAGVNRPQPEERREEVRVALKGYRRGTRVGHIGPQGRSELFAENDGQGQCVRVKLGPGDFVVATNPRGRVVCRRSYKELRDGMPMHCDGSVLIGRVVGRVVTAGGLGIPGVIVCAQVEGVTLGAESTGSGGRFEIADLGDRDYRIVVLDQCGGVLFETVSVKGERVRDVGVVEAAL